MHGTAVTRVSSQDGARAYTVYDKGNGHMFIHALDTVHGKAVCIDLPRVSVGAAIGLQLQHDGGTLDVTQNGAAFQRIDTTSYVMSPATTRAAPVATAPAGAGGGGGGLPAGLLAAIAAAVLAAAAAVVVVRRGRLPTWRPRSD
jgi:DNA-binding beta-propeller fold protein YncE